MTFTISSRVGGETSFYLSLHPQGQGYYMLTIFLHFYYLVPNFFDQVIQGMKQGMELQAREFCQYAGEAGAKKFKLGTDINQAFWALLKHPLFYMET